MPVRNRAPVRSEPKDGGGKGPADHRGRVGNGRMGSIVRMPDASVLERAREILVDLRLRGVQPGRATRSGILTGC